MQRELQKFTAHIFTRSSNPRKFSQFGEFRRILFVETLGWDLMLRNDYELDEFDHDRAHYLTLSVGEEIVGGFRAIRCDHPYLAKTKFPDLAEFHQFPSKPKHWEISRFGVATKSVPRSTAAILYSLMLNFGLQRQAEGLVAFTSLGHEHYLRRLGVVTRRYGEPSRIGEPGTTAHFTVVAGEIPLNAQQTGVLSRLISISNNVRLVDATSIQRPARATA
jgi:acyl homoserine lactone synthase